MSDHYLHVIGEKTNYRSLSQGIKIYIHASSRADRKLMEAIRRKITLLAPGVLLAAPFFLNIDINLRMFSGLAFLVWLFVFMQQLFILYYKKFGQETLKVTPGKIHYSRHMIHPLGKLVLRKIQVSAPVEINAGYRSSVSSNAFVSSGKINLNIIRIIRRKSVNQLMITDTLREGDVIRDLILRYI